jgi:hypothetical protein
MRTQSTSRVGRILRPALVLLSVAGLTSGCGESTSPSGIAGTWVATSFQFTQVGQAPVNVLALGGAMSITIAANNATSGTLTIPGSLIGGSDLSLSMAGTAVRTGNTVEFDQAADSFVRDVAFTLAGNTMQGTYTNSGVTVDVTLTRQASATAYP